GDGVLAKEIDGNAKRRVQKNEQRSQPSWRHLSTAHPHQKWNQQEVLEAVVQHDRMAKSFGVGKLYGPWDARDASDDLPIDEFADPAAAQDQGSGNCERIENRPERSAVDEAECQHARRA